MAKRGSSRIFCCEVGRSGIEFHTSKEPWDGGGKEGMAEEGNKVVDLNSAYPKDECLYVFEPDAFNAWVAGVFEDKFEKFDRTNDLHVRLRRKLKSRAADVSTDAAGRIMISAEQREAVGIDKEVVVVGNTGYFEIWDAKRYDAVDDETDLGLLFD